MEKNYSFIYKKRKKNPFFTTIENNTKKSVFAIVIYYKIIVKLISHFHGAKNYMHFEITYKQFNTNLIENKTFQNQNNKNFLSNLYMIIIILILNINLYI